jgi:U3 small nucleolar RNA-associated protein 7
MDEEQKQKLREEKVKKRMRGKNKSLKRYLRKQRKNVIDPATVCLLLPFPLRLFIDLFVLCLK